jgi:RHS repeat-associated protein
MESDPRPKTRVGGSRPPSAGRARRFPSQALEPHQETVTLDSTTVSGIVEWLSNDPIGISGGLNQYVFCGNNPVNFTDPFGLCTDIDEDVETYTKDLKAANLGWWQIWSLYKFSISEGRDTKWDAGTHRFKKIYAGGGSQMGNLKAGYALADVYGPVWAFIMTRGAEAVAPFEGILRRRGDPDRRPTDNVFTVFYFDPKGSFEQNDLGVEIWKQTHLTGTHPASDWQRRVNVDGMSHIGAAIPAF